VAYDEHLGARIHEILRDHEGVTSKRMFGGIAFMLCGNMACGVVKDDLCLRLGHELGEQALAEPHTRPMDFTGKPMRGFVYVDPEGTKTDDDLRRWVERAVAFASTLPPKQGRR
jgi:TfoX/Sxy family transcriptional regulator of competence genes